MPTLDDAPTVETLDCSAALTGDAADSTDVATELHEQDLVQVYDVSEQKAKVVTLELLAKALGVTI